MKSHTLMSKLFWAIAMLSILAGTVIAVAGATVSPAFQQIGLIVMLGPVLFAKSVDELIR